MALNTTTTPTMGGTNGYTYQAYRERATAAALVGVSGSCKIILEGGATITGTVDTTLIGSPGTTPNAPGGVLKITDSTPTTWLVPLSNIVAIGQ